MHDTIAVHNDVYEFTISGSTGTLEGTTPINDVTLDHAFWIKGRKIVVASGGGSVQSADYFNYRVGGTPTKVITKGIAGPQGLTISPAQK